MMRYSYCILEFDDMRDSEELRGFRSCENEKRR